MTHYTSLGAFLIVQLVLSTEYGIAGGGIRHQLFEVDARVVVNFHRIQPAKVGLRSINLNRPGFGRGFRVGDYATRGSSLLAR